MAKRERIREVLPHLPDQGYFHERADAGWRLVAVERERPTPEDLAKAAGAVEDVPFGLRIASDCLHLEEDPAEMQALKILVEMIVQDVSLSRMAEELNKQGLSLRDGRPWDPIAVFKIFPRVIEVAPRILSGDEWTGANTSRTSRGTREQKSRLTFRQGFAAVCDLDDELAAGACTGAAAGFAGPKRFSNQARASSGL